MIDRLFSLSQLHDQDLLDVLLASQPEGYPGSDRQPQAPAQRYCQCTGNASNTTTLAPTAATAADNSRWGLQKDDAGTKEYTKNTKAAMDAAARTSQGWQNEIISYTNDIRQLSRFNGQAAMVTLQWSGSKTASLTSGSL